MLTCQGTFQGKLGVLGDVDLRVGYTWSVESIKKYLNVWWDDSLPFVPSDLPFTLLHSHLG